MLASLSEFITQFLPFRAVQENQWGIRWTFGRLRKIVQGQMLWGIPFIQPLDVLDATWGALFPSTQCLSTADDRAIAIRIGLEWKIQDAKKFVLLIGENDSDEVIAVIIQSLVANVISKSTLSDIITKQKSTETKITNQIAGIMEEYGILVKRAHIVECVPVFPIKVFANEKNTVVNNI